MTYYYMINSNMVTSMDENPPDTDNYVYVSPQMLIKNIKNGIVVETRKSKSSNPEYSVSNIAHAMLNPILTRKKKISKPKVKKSKCKCK